jgi:hypothetical protein
MLLLPSDELQGIKDWLFLDLFEKGLSLLVDT